MKKFLSYVNDNKKTIIVRTVIVAGAVVGVTLAAGLIKVVPTDKAVEAVDNVAKAARKAAE